MEFLQINSFRCEKLQKLRNIGLKLIETEEWKNKGENRTQKSSKCHITTNAHHCRKEKAENAILFA